VTKEFHFLDIRAFHIRRNKKWLCNNVDLILRSEEFSSIHFKDAFKNQPEFMAGFGEPQ
jgi:hypothetical protein